VDHEANRSEARHGGWYVMSGGRILLQNLSDGDNSLGSQTRRSHSATLPFAED
jgi:hypothetical protein